MIKMKNNKGFTLIELLTVMAISLILMGLMLAPLVGTFKLTRQAQAMIDSQNAARMALEVITRELGQAMFVYDNASYEFDDQWDGLPNGKTPIMLPVLQPGNSTQWFVLPYAKIDFILPKLYMHCNNPAHNSSYPRDYPRSTVITGDGATRTELYDWPPCPYCGSDNVEAKPKLPLEQDTTIVRYFLGLKYNSSPGEKSSLPTGGWVSPWGKNIVDGTENQVILYRVEFNPHDDNLFPADMPQDQRRSDPYFFYRTSRGKNGEPICDNWMSIARVVGIGKYEDLITAKTDDNGKVLSVEPTITFHMKSVENDTFAPAYSVDKINDYPTAAPTVFSASYGYWTPDYRVDVLRGDFTNNPTSAVDYFTEIDLNNGDLRVMKCIQNGAGWTNTVEFNVSDYTDPTRSSYTGYVPADGTTPREMAFTVDPNKGTVNFALQPARQNLAKTGPVYTYNTAAINNDFNTASVNDRAGVTRKALLPTFDDTNSDQYNKNARVVPGSEKVIGPNMTFGSSFGLPVRYERVPLQLGDAVKNQYKIDYDNGLLYFSSDPNLPLPEHDVNNKPCTIQIYYLIYFNKSDDVVRADYLTKSLIDVHMGMRMFDPESGKPFPVNLNSSVKVRNALR